METKMRSECTPDECLQYLRYYFATVDLMADAQNKFDILAGDATSVSDRSLYRAKSLEAERDLELLKNQRRAFLSDEAGIQPPSEAAVQMSEDLTAKLAAIEAEESKAATIIQITTKAIDAFNKLNA